ncbi:hypothetical protein VN97_g12671, partial [Penicillium thymicola]
MNADFLGVPEGSYFEVQPYTLLFNNYTNAPQDTCSNKKKKKKKKKTTTKSITKPAEPGS